jgi:hypothetical protein
MTPEARRIPDALLERYLTDSLDAEEKARLEACLADSPQDRARLGELRADSAAFLIQHPPALLVSRFQEGQRRALWWRRSALLIPALAAAAVVLVLLPPIEDPYTAKGLVLVLHRKTETGSLQVPDGGALAPRDSVRFAVKAPVNGFVAVLSRDARGMVTVYYPFKGKTAAAYRATEPMLPGALELDDTLGPEDVYALHSTQPFELKWAVEALKAGRPLAKAAPAGISVGRASFVKVPPPQK